MANYSSPGVYVVEQNAFPNSAVAVETAVPAFIGYTFKAERAGKSLIRVPTRINSFAEYVESFGGAFRPTFELKDPSAASSSTSFKLGDIEKLISYKEDNELYFFNSIRLFYANGGGPCVILSVGVYGNQPSRKVLASDFTSTTDNPEGPLEILKNVQEPTLIVMPDVAKLGAGAYGLYAKVLAHCADMQSRFGIFDLRNHVADEKPDAIALEFRDDIGINSLNYGAAYYPWLNTDIVGEEELSFENFAAELKENIEPEVGDIFRKYDEELVKLQATATRLDAAAKLAKDAAATPANADAKPAVKATVPPVDDKNATQAVVADEVTVKETVKGTENQIKNLKKNHHLALKSSSLYYRIILAQARTLYNQMPPSAAIAGLYTMVDNKRGVWKAPANYSLNSVTGPIVNISSEVQEKFNVDPFTGKSINVIRPFAGLGTLVWGGRTLDGNSQDWKYINVRRTLIMIEQSVKAAARAYVFEPNDANTWITVKAMISNFLTNLWKQGALAGAVPEQAFDVQIGLGSTMTPTDILEGKMLISIKLAVVRPAEFIIITFQQQLQQS